MDITRILPLLSPCETNRQAAGPITGLGYNSKTVKPGELFFCLRGNLKDGHDFAGEAVAQGATALVVEEFLPLPVLQVRVADSRTALSRAGRLYYGDPAARLGLAGVTGTNGKTTTTFFLRAILKELHRPIGLIGTVFSQFGGGPEPSSLTTPESLDLWRLLARAAEDGCDWVVMEVSSHALAMGRVEPSDFDIAVVTNITRDHFEYHGTYEHYRQSKERLVRCLSPERKAGRPKAAVLNADNPAAAALSPAAGVPVITYGLAQPADVRATEVETRAHGSRFLLHLPGTTPTPVRLPLPGLFNVSNALAAAAAGWAAGVPLTAIAGGLEGCSQVPGRTEAIDEGQPFQVIVDFAHNPDALAKIVTLRPDQPHGRTILVFGAEGGKDRGKRPQMGEAARGADFAIVTSDNIPREEPVDVAREVAAGLGGHPHEIILDRREAIEQALRMARPGDLVIVAGRGHEQTWVYEGRRIAFDDRAVIREILRGLRKGMVYWGE